MGDGTAFADPFVAAEVATEVGQGGPAEKLGELRGSVEKLQTVLKPRRTSVFLPSHLLTNLCPGGSKANCTHAGALFYDSMQLLGGRRYTSPRTVCGTPAVAVTSFVKAFTKALWCYQMVVDEEARAAGTNLQPPATGHPHGGIGLGVGRQYDWVGYMRTDLWFATPPPSVETLSMRHVTVPFCNPLPAAKAEQCDRGGQALDVRLRSRSDAFYNDALGRGTPAGCDVATDWMGVMPRHLAESYFRSHESALLNPPNCASHKSKCHCHANAVNPECFLSSYLAYRHVPITRRSFGFIALARQVLPAPLSPSGEYTGGDAVFTNIAIDANGINALDCQTKADYFLPCPRFCARSVYTARLSSKVQPLSMVCFPTGRKPLPPKPPSPTADELTQQTPSRHQRFVGRRGRGAQVPGGRGRGRWRGRGRGALAAPTATAAPALMYANGTLMTNGINSTAATATPLTDDDIPDLERPLATQPDVTPSTQAQAAMAHDLPGAFVGRIGGGTVRVPPLPPRRAPGHGAPVANQVMRHDQLMQIQMRDHQRQEQMDQLQLRERRRRERKPTPLPPPRVGRVQRNRDFDARNAALVAAQHAGRVQAGRQAIRAATEQAARAARERAAQRMAAQRVAQVATPAVAPPQPARTPTPRRGKRKGKGRGEAG